LVAYVTRDPRVIDYHSSKPSMSLAARLGDGLSNSKSCSRYLERIKAEMDLTIHVTPEQRRDFLLAGIEAIVLKKIGNPLFLTQGLFDVPTARHPAHPTAGPNEKKRASSPSLEEDVQHPHTQSHSKKR
jgi:hypothetical protein